MPNTCQSIIFSVDGNNSPPCAIFGREGSLNSVGMRCDLEAIRSQKSYEIVVGFVLDESQFGIIVDLITSLDW